MKILILANNDVGLYKFRRELIVELLKENEVFISLPYGKYVDELILDGCHYLKTDFNRRGTNPVSDIKLIIQYMLMIAKIKPDVVLTYTIKPNVYGGLACRLLKVPYISNVTGLGTTLENGGLLSLLTKTLYKIGLKRANCVFFQNAENLNYFEKNKLYIGQSCLIPGSGVNTNAHCFEEYPENDNPIKFLFIGRIMKDKGINELLESMDYLSTNNNVVLDILGNCDEDYGDIIQSKESLGYIKWHGMQDDVHSYIKMSHCVVLPSYHEGMANVLLEASSTGRPVIASNVPGCKEIVDDEITGFLCEAKDTQSLIHSMEKMIALSQNEKKMMGKKAREKVIKEFDRKTVVNAYIKEIDSIRTGKRL